MMRVVVKHPGQRPSIEDIEPGLDSYHKIVGGNLERVMSQRRFFGDDWLLVVAYDEALPRGLPFNLRRPSDGSPVAGTLLAVKVDPGGSDVSMTMDDAERVVQVLIKMSPRDDV